MTGQVTRVTVWLKFWKRGGKKGSNKFIYKEVTTDIVMGVGYEGRLQAVVNQYKGGGWGWIPSSGYRIKKYHYD